MIYDDIIDLPHYVSPKRPQMSMADRAAQFSPFAALTGFDGEIAETNRLVEQFADMDENYLCELDENLLCLKRCIAERPLAEITFFVPDEVKNGGSYKTIRGNVKRIDDDLRQIVLADKQVVPLKYVCVLKVI